MSRVKKSDQLLSKLGQSLDKTPRSAGHRAPAAAVDAPASDSAAPDHPPASKSHARPARSRSTARVAAPIEEPGADHAADTPTLTAPLSGAAARHAQANDIVARHLPFALGAGFVPVPLVDVAAISGVQLKMLAELAALYQVPFSPSDARTIIVALLGGTGAWTLAVAAFGSAVKFVPGLGWVGSGTLPIMSGAVTFAVGHIFVQHFDAGGTLQNFDTAAMRQVFLAKLEEGKAAVRARV